MDGDSPAASLSPRRRQFSLQTLLVLTAAFAVILGCPMISARRQARSLQPIRALGARVTYNYDAPKWANDLIGDDFFSDVVGIDFSATRIKDGDLQPQIPTLQSLHSLRWINLTQPELSEKTVVLMEDSLPGVLVIHPSAQDSN